MGDLIFDKPVPTVGGNHLLYDLMVKVRPTDGLAFILGAKTTVYLTHSANPNMVIDINDSGQLNPNQWPSLAFGNDGTGFAAWRFTPTGYRAYMRVIPPGWTGGALPRGFNLSDRIPGVTLMDQPSVAFSQKVNKLYVAGWCEVNGVARLGFAESGDNGVSFGGVVLIDTDPTRSNMAPELTVGRDDDVFIAYRLGDNLKVASRSKLNGGWEIQTLVNSSILPGWDVRGVDGRVTKNVAVAPDGTAYLVWKNSVSKSIGMHRLLAGAPKWEINESIIPPNNLAAHVMRCDVAPDGTLIVAVGFDGGTYTGVYCFVSTDKGLHFSAGIPVHQRNTYETCAIGLDASAIGGKIHAAAAYRLNLPEQTFYISAPYTGTILPPVVVTPTPVPVPPPVVVPPAPVPTPVPVLAVPSSLAAEALNYNSVRLTWKDKSDNETGFIIERATAGRVFTVIATVQPNTTLFIDNTVQPATTYLYKIKARNNTAYSNYTLEVSVTVPPSPLGTTPVPVPPPPTPVTPVVEYPEPNRWIPPQTGIEMNNVYGFLTFWKANGGLPILGYPIRGAELLPGSNTIVIQYCERARLECHLDKNNEITLGLLGTEMVAILKQSGKL